ncbi:MAG TPA: phosphate acyltransferase PlsX [Pseudomonadales bacterium]
MTARAIAIDVMSGDFGPRVLVPASLRYLRQHPELFAYLVGDRSEIAPLLDNSVRQNVSIVHTDDVIAMHESPVAALRHKKRSSIHLAVELVRNGEAGACLSAGNTGALMAISKYLLRTIDGIDRPAICGALPSLYGHSYLLDMGANVDCEAEHLLQFALMASVMVSLLERKPLPTVALLNNGEEAIKGNSQVREAARLLTEHERINYIGYVEGHRMFEAVADIIVCDGFVGNIALKASEGVASYILQKIRQEVRADWISRCLSLFAWPALYRVKNSIDPRVFNGASLLGLQGVVVKSHGHADAKAFYHALGQAHQLMESNMIQKLVQVFSKPNQQGDTA